MGKPRGQGRYEALRLAVAGLRTVQLSILLAGMLLAWGSGAYALDSALDVSQYAHTAWKVRDGFVKGAIFSIAQTPDGYLWLGTEFGLFRFDGVRAVPWQPPADEQLPDIFIEHLLVGRDGTLWIGTRRGLASWKEGKLTNYPELAGLSIQALLEDHEGTVWIGVSGLSAGKLCASKGPTIQCYGAGQLGQSVSALYEDHKDNLWVSAATGLWRWAPGPPEQYAFPRGVVHAASLIEDDNGALLMSTTYKGLKQLVGGKIKNYTLPGISGPFNPGVILRSRDGALWIGSFQGLLHLHQGRVDGFKASDGLSTDFVSPIFEDREGNLWVGTQDGLDRFREVAVPTISRNQGLSNSAAWSVQASADGSIWIGTADGLNRWENGRVTLYRSRKPLVQSRQGNERDLSVSGTVKEIANSGLTGDIQSLGQDARGRLWASTIDGVFYFEGGRFVRIPGVPGGFTFSIAGDGNGDVWISNSERGLFHWTEGSAVQRIPWSWFGEKRAMALVPDRLQGGGLWLGFSEGGGIAHLKDGQVRASYKAADGLGNDHVTGLRVGSGGAVWASTEGGLSRIEDGHIATLTSKNSLPCDAVHWSVEDDDHAVWLYMPCGLVRIARSELDAWVSDPKRTIQTTVLDISDGARSPAIAGGYPPTVTKSPDGRIWFLPRDGVSVIDPRHLPFNKLPPPVHIEQITADHKTYWQNWSGDASSSLPKLPPLVRDLAIDYTALSLVVPEKVRFRYKLEGLDREWQDAGTRRQAFYTNLSPRKYRFRVMACNNSGVWNEKGAFLDFSVAPAYYQTTWFRLSCVAAFLALLWALYELRLRQLAREFNAGLEARVNERTRIARELHDSLLQGFQGLMFRLQAVRNMLPGRPAEASEALDIALERGDKAIAEGRDTVADLRQPVMDDGDIAQALTALGEELAAQSDNGTAPCVRVLLEGKQRELNPILRDEIYRIAREALRNAFRHARAQKIEAEITYSDSEFLLHVRDDGGGIDPAVANQGARAGHWGLPGMRERAKRFGGKLEVWSEHGAGTEIELSVPGAIAYGKSEPRRRFWLWRKKIGESDGQRS
jgi:signal transduction histidine kinase/ligand-binding sensor domain-containing protein